MNEQNQKPAPNPAAATKPVSEWQTGDKATRCHVLGRRYQYRVEVEGPLPMGGRELKKGNIFTTTFSTDLARMVKCGDLSIKGGE